MTTTVTVYSTVTTYHPRTTDGVVTEFVPLTTTFTANPDCSTADFHNNVDQQFDNVLIAYDPRFSYAFNGAPVTCVPSQAWEWFEYRTIDMDTVEEGDLPTVWSLMPVTCPDEWYTARTSTADPSMLQVTCCPEGYTVDPFQDHRVEANCFTTLDPGETIYYFSTAPDDDVSTLDPELSRTAFLDTVTVAAVAVKGYMPLAPTTSAVTSTIAPVASVHTEIVTLTSPPVSSPSNTVGDSNTESSSSSSSHPSGGAIAGSVIGSLAGVGLIGLGAFMCFRRRKAKQSGDNEIKEGSMPASDPTAQYEYSIVGQNVPGDRSTVLSELPTISNTPELFSEHDATSPRTGTDPHEME